MIKLETTNCARYTAFATLFLMIIAVSACRLPGRQIHELTIKNVKEDETFVLEPHKSSHTAEVIVDSQVDGLFAVTVSDEQMINQKFDSLGTESKKSLLRGDWYQNPPMTLTYHGHCEMEGEVSLEVIFYY